ncbi:unnamed protein product [Caenorhabditis sp. 36 PRJEB53466]|nr:unnamed protein product [Caenorhabditis sp. 36 PRJEB53466]
MNQNSSDSALFQALAHRKASTHFMVHKKFVNPTSTRENNWIDRTPHPEARNYLDEMAPINGFHPENSESIRLRDAFRDEVSKRMGELLLKGQTMLDEYCPTCSGILMEDRTGVRRCVTCELYTEKLNETPHVVAEIPLQSEDLKEAAEIPVPTPKVSEQKAAKKVLPSKVATPVTKAKKVVETSEERSLSDAVSAAKQAVLQKLEWATAELNATEESARVLNFLAVIQKSAETLSALQI